ncbi:hypothetical protein [Methylobacterium sp. A54F]
MVQPLTPTATPPTRGRTWAPARDARRPAPVEVVSRSGARLPCQWVIDGGLRLFRDDVAYRGRSAAALKILLTVALMADEGADRVTALLSYEDLNRLSGLSTVLISAGKKLLTTHGLIDVAHEGQGRRIRYVLNGGPDEAHAMVPRGRGDADANGDPIAKLRALSCARALDLDALKLYVVACALAGARSQPVPVRASVVAELTNIRAAKVAEALEALRERRLVALRPSLVRDAGGGVEPCIDLLPWC